MHRVASDRRGFSMSSTIVAMDKMRKKGKITSQHACTKVVLRFLGNLFLLLCLLGDERSRRERGLARLGTPYMPHGRAAPVLKPRYRVPFLRWSKHDAPISLSVVAILANTSKRVRAPLDSMGLFITPGLVLVEVPLWTVPHISDSHAPTNFTGPHLSYSHVHSRSHGLASAC